MAEKLIIYRTAKFRVHVVRCYGNGVTNTVEKQATNHMCTKYRELILVNYSANFPNVGASSQFHLAARYVARGKCSHLTPRNSN